MSDSDARVLPPAETRFLTLAIVAAALLVGGCLRFANLGAREMSPDEGASWAAASAKSLADVIRLQTHLNPGKAGVHDLLLHAWIKAFGDSLEAMRSLSALTGTIAIILVFFVAQELVMPAEPVADDGQRRRSGGSELVGAVAAAVFAVNLVTIKYAREARMYPLLLDAILVQILFFFRAARRGGIVNQAAVVVTTAGAIAIHLSSAFAFSAELLWILYRGIRTRFDLSEAETRRLLALSVALALGIAMLAPILPRILSSSEHAVAGGAIRWITPPPPWAPAALFNKATGTFAFPVMALLAVWGGIRGWSRSRDGVEFAFFWMLAPPLVLMGISLLLRPVFVERYLLSCFVPFFLLVAIGINQTGALRSKLTALAIVSAFALGHVHAYERKPHDAQWREAATIAAAGTANNASIAVAPGYAVNVVRYYLRARRDAASACAFTDAAHARIAIVAESGLAANQTSKLRTDYPRPLAQLRGIVIRGR